MMMGLRRLVMGLSVLLVLGVTACIKDGRDVVAADLVGTWKAKVLELNVPAEIVWHVRPDGTTGYTFTTAAGTATSSGTWTFANGVVYEKGSDGVPISSSIQWLDRNSFVLTIKDNGDPAYRGITRLYQRI